MTREKKGRRQRPSPEGQMTFLRRSLGWKPRERRVTEVRKGKEGLVSALQRGFGTVAHLPTRCRWKPDWQEKPAEELGVGGEPGGRWTDQKGRELEEREVLAEGEISRLMP